jgi:hypothetical protein
VDVIKRHDTPKSHTQQRKCETYLGAMSGVLESLRLALRQIREHRIDQLLILAGPLRLCLLPHHGRLHRWLLFSQLL